MSQTPHHEQSLLSPESAARAEFAARVAQDAVGTVAFHTSMDINPDDFRVLEATLTERNGVTPTHLSSRGGYIERGDVPYFVSYEERIPSKRIYNDNFITRAGVKRDEFSGISFCDIDNEGEKTAVTFSFANGANYKDDTRRPGNRMYLGLTLPKATAQTMYQALERDPRYITDIVEETVRSLGVDEVHVANIKNAIVASQVSDRALLIITPADQKPGFLSMPDEKEVQYPAEPVSLTDLLSSAPQIANSNEVPRPIADEAHQVNTVSAGASENNVTSGQIPKDNPLSPERGLTDTQVAQIANVVSSTVMKTLGLGGGRSRRDPISAETNTPQGDGRTVAYWKFGDKEKDQAAKDAKAIQERVRNIKLAKIAAETDALPSSEEVYERDMERFRTALENMINSSVPTQEIEVLRQTDYFTPSKFSLEEYTGLDAYNTPGDGVKWYETDKITEGWILESTSKGGDIQSYYVVTVEGEVYETTCLLKHDAATNAGGRQAVKGSSNLFEQRLRQVLDDDKKGVPTYVGTSYAPQSEVVKRIKKGIAEMESMASYGG